MTKSNRLLGSLSFINSTMPEMAQRISDKPLILFLDNLMRGIGQISIMNNPLTGLLILAAITIGEPRHGFAMFIGVLVPTLIAYLSKLDQGAINNGLFGFNGALVGAALNVFLDPQQFLLIIIYTIIVSAISVPVMAFMVVWLGFSSDGTISPLTLPFNFVTLLFLMLLQVVRHNALPEEAAAEADPTVAGVNNAIRDEPDGSALDMTPLLIAQIVFRGISQLFLIDNAAVGLGVIVAIACCSRISAVAALLGSIVGTSTALAMGADGYSIYLGLFGYNGFVTAIAIAGVFVRFSIGSFILGLMAAGLSSLIALGMQSSFDLVNMPVLTLPFCIATLVIILYAKVSDRFDVLPLSEVATPEDHIRARR